MWRLLSGIVMLLFIYSCKMNEPEIMTPTIFCNGLIKAAFDGDSSFFLERIENPNKLRNTLKHYKDLRPNMKEYENLLMSDNMQYDRMKDSAIRMYQGLKDSIQKFGIQKIVFDTVDFNNYINNYRPYYKLDADAYIYQNNERYVLQIKEAILLADGWNLGSVRIFKPAPDEILIRVLDSLKHATKTDPRNIRIMDSLKKINYQVKENPFLE